MTNLPLPHSAATSSVYSCPTIGQLFASCQVPPLQSSHNATTVNQHGRPRAVRLFDGGNLIPLIPPGCESDSSIIPPGLPRFTTPHQYCTIRPHRLQGPQWAFIFRRGLPGGVSDVLQGVYKRVRAVFRGLVGKVYYPALKGPESRIFTICATGALIVGYLRQLFHALHCHGLAVVVQIAEVVEKPGFSIVLLKFFS